MRAAVLGTIVLAGLCLYPPLRAELSVEQLRSAATGGDGEAAFRLGRAYKLGDGVAADARQAERWLEKAAQLGHAKGGDEFGLVLLQSGKPREALPWLKKAAERGDRRAQYGLATILFAGSAGPADPDQARLWMGRAARAGLPAAKEALTIMSKPGLLEPTASRPYEIVTVRPANRPATPPEPSAAAWAVQLGAFAQPENARRQWKAVRGAPGLKASFPVRDGLTRLRLGPFRTGDEARRFCAAQHRLERECFAVRSEGG